MKKIFSPEFSGTALISLLSLAIVFHILVLLGAIPHTVVWGGRIENNSQYLLLESISILINLLMLVVVMVKTRVIKLEIHPKIISAMLWLMFGLFILNTFGNLFSKNDFEKWAFTPLTLLLSIFCFQLARVREK